MAVETRLSRHVMEAHPDHAARVLEQLPAEQAAAAIGTVSGTVAAAVVGSMETIRATDCLRKCSGNHAAEIVAAMPVEQAVVVLRRMDPSHREELLDRMDKDGARRLQRVLAYPEGTAGSLMETAVVAFPDDIAAGEALRRSRQQSQRVRFYVYVTDRNHRLMGVLTLRELMQAPPGRSLGEIARRPVERLHDRDERDKILVQPAWQSFHALPVVDDAGLLVGVLRYETLRRLEAETSANRPPDLLVLGAALTHTWVGMAALLLDGFGGALMALPSRRVDDRKEPRDE